MDSQNINVNVLISCQGVYCDPACTSKKKKNQKFSYHVIDQKNEGTKNIRNITGGRGNLFKNCCISVPPKQFKTQAVLLADFQHGKKKKKKGAYFSSKSSDLDNMLTMSYFITLFNRGKSLFEKKSEVFINEQHTLGSKVRHYVHKINSTCILIKEESRLCSACAQHILI